MILKKHTLLLALSYFFLVNYSTLAHAQDLVIDLKQSLEIAAEKNPSYKASKEQVKASQLNVKSSYGNFLPNINLNTAKYKSSIEFPSTVAEAESAQINLEGNLNLFNGFYDQALVTQNKVSLEISKTELINLNAIITYEVKLAYYEALYAKEYILLLEKIRDRRKEQLDMIYLRFQGGREDKGSYLQAQAKYESALYELRQGERLLQSSLQNLAYRLGYRHAPDFQIKGSLELDPSLTLNMDNLDPVIKKIPEYILAQKQIDLAESQIQQMDSQFLPRLDLTGSIGRRGESFDDLNKSWNLGIQFSIPLFEGGSRFYNSSSARKQKASKVYLIENTYNSLKAGLTLSYNNYLNYLQNIDVQEKFLEASRLRAEVTTSQYKSGLTTYTSWDLVQNELINYEKNKLLSLKSFLVSQAELQKLMGHGELQ